MLEHRTLAPIPARSKSVDRTRGLIHVHSAPRALIPHVEWALGAVLGEAAPMHWAAQPLAAGHLRAELTWAGLPGTAARLVSSLRLWDRLRVEVTEEASEGHEGERYALTPTLGIYRAAVGAHGDIQVGEERLRGALDRSVGDPVALRSEIQVLLGTPWDAELEPFRCAAAGGPVRWLHQTG